MCNTYTACVKNLIFMALTFHASTFAHAFSSQLSWPRGRPYSGNSSGPVSKTIRRTSNDSSRITKQVENQIGTVVRRSANYKPSAWDYDYLQSLSNNYQGDVYLKRSAKLKEDVRIMLDKAVDPLDGLELIDDLQRLGVFYHFEEEIKRVLEKIHSNRDDKWNKEEDLYATALKFRILRQHGYDVPQDIFKNFTDEKGNFTVCIYEDIKGLLHLYEASYFLVDGENILEEARDFTTKILKQSLKMRKDIDEDLKILVSHALELPLHWRMPRVEARWFIDVYERKSDINHTLLQLAQLDFNVVQATHQEDLKQTSRWWKSTELGEKLSFVRDSLIECFLWTIGMDFKPQASILRRNVTIANNLLTTIDDVYDIYGTLDELELFTNAVERWDIGALEQLPTYMKICFLALFNSINETGYDILKEQGIVVIPYLQKLWADLCKCYLVEAKWYYSGYTPSLEEYMNNASISIAAPVILAHAYVFSTNPTIEGLEYLGKYPNLIQWSAIVLRLADDLGTSGYEMKRGDVPKSIQCYMHETGASEKDAREHIKYLINETWKKMNGAQPADSPFSDSFVVIAKNLGRMAQCIYEYGDGHAGECGETKDRLSSLLINPIRIV